MRKTQKQIIRQNEVAVTKWRDFLSENGFSKIREAEKIDRANGGTIYVEYGKENERVLIRQDYDNELNIIAYRVFRAAGVAEMPK